MERARKGTYLPGRRGGGERRAGLSGHLRLPRSKRRLTSQLLLEGRLPGWGGARGQLAGAGPSSETVGSRLGSFCRLGKCQAGGQRCGRGLELVAEIPRRAGTVRSRRKAKRAPTCRTEAHFP